MPTANYPTSIACTSAVHAWNLQGVGDAGWEECGGVEGREGGAFEIGNMHAWPGQEGILEPGYGTVRATREKKPIVGESVDVLHVASGKNKSFGHVACHRRVKSQN